MKKLLIPILSIILLSCGNGTDTVQVPKTEYDKLKALAPKPLVPEYPETINNPNLNKYSKWFDTWQIVMIDSCEYIFSYTTSFDGGPILSHKGNCKFCEKRMDAKLKKLETNLRNSNILSI